MASCATTKTKTRIESKLNQQGKERKDKGDNGINMKRYCLTVHSSTPLCFSRKDPWWRDTSSNHCSHTKSVHSSHCRMSAKRDDLPPPGKRRLFADKQEDDDQDYTLLDELYNDGTKPQGDNGFFEQLFRIESTAVELDDLDDWDPSMLGDMMDSGMTVPDVDDV